MADIQMSQEELDALVQSKISEATSGLYTKEQFEKELQREADRRVQQGIETAIAKQKPIWEQEFKKKSEMTIEEQLKEQYNAKFQEISDLQSTLQLQSNRVDAKSKLTDAKIPQEHYEKFMDVLVTGDQEKTTANVDSFINMFNATRESIEKELKSSMSNVTPPNKGNGAKTMTKEEFNALSFAEQVEMKKNNPELFQKMIK